MGNRSQSVTHHSWRNENIDDPLFRNIFRLPPEISQVIISEWLGYKVKLSSDLREEIRRWLIIQRRVILRNDIENSLQLNENSMGSTLYYLTELCWIKLKQEKDVDVMKDIMVNNRFRIRFIYKNLDIVTSEIVRFGTLSLIGLVTKLIILNRKFYAKIILIIMYSIFSYYQYYSWMSYDIYMTKQLKE